MIGFEGARNAIVAKIQAVPGVGIVYGYLRLVASESDILADMLSTGRLHYWSVAPAASNPHATERHPSHAKLTYRYDVHVFYALDGAGLSQQAFTTVVRAVQDDFEAADKKLGNLVVECGPLQWTGSDERMLANVLCHHAQLSLSVIEHPDS